MRDITELVEKQKEKPNKHDAALEALRQHDYELMHTFKHTARGKRSWPKPVKQRWYK